MHFAFAVNYIRYVPMGAKFAEVTGYFLNTAREELQSFVNKNNQTYLYDFGGKFSKLSIIEQPYDVDTYMLKDYKNILITAPIAKEEAPWWKFW